MGRVLAEEAVKVTSIKEDGVVIVSLLPGWVMGVLGVSIACCRRAEPCGATVCDVWVEVGVEKGAVGGDECFKISRLVLSKAAVSPFSRAHDAAICTECTGHPSFCMGGLRW